MTEKLIKYKDLLPVIQSQKDSNADLLKQLFELTEAKKKAKEEAKSLSDELDITNSRIKE